MFNSTLLDDYDYEPLKKAIQERQIEIVEFPYSLWKNAGDDIFDDFFQSLFHLALLIETENRQRK